MKPVMLSILLSTYFSAVTAFAEEAKNSTPAFDYSFLYSDASSEYTSYWLLFSPIPGKDVIASCNLKKDGKLIDVFPLRKTNFKDKNGNEKVRFYMRCLSKDLVSSGTIYLSVISNEKSKKTEYYQFPFKTAKLRPKGKL